MDGGEERRASAWRFVRAIVRSQADGVTGAVISGLLWQVGAVGAPLVVKYAIDRGIVPRNHHTFLLGLIGLLGVGLRGVCAGGLRHIYAIRNRSASDARVRDAIFAHALRLDPAYHDRVGPGELLSRASSDSTHVARMMDAIGHTIGYALTVVAVATVMLILDWKLALLEMLPLIGIGAVLWVGGRQAISGHLSTGTFVAFSAYVVMLVWPLRVLGQRVTTVQKALAASARITEVLEAEPRLVEARHPEELAAKGDVRLDNVSFGHEGDQAVLDGLDLHLAPGESLALVGSTGSGKSTVAGLLARLYDPDGGRVLLDGHDLRELRLADVRRAVALVFEETFLFSESVRENTRFGGRDGGDEDGGRAAALAGATEFISRLPEGYDTVLGERGFSLSGGQRQRIAIARAILADPAVLVLDDATSAVDAAKEQEIRTALAQVMRERTTIVIAHRPATIALADRVCVLENGRIVEEGTHAELLRRSTRYRALLALETEAA